MRFIAYFLWILPSFCLALYPKAVTYELGGRLGDNLLNYTHAKWISYKGQIPLLLKPFKYSDQFIFHDVEEHLPPKELPFYGVKFLTSLRDLEQKNNFNTLFMVAHCPDSYDEYLFLRWPSFYVPVDWKDKVFKEKMRALIAPKRSLSLIYPPSDKISVALHVRLGGGFVKDTEAVKGKLPLRFPELEFYFQQLSDLYALVHQESLYVYLFTDSPEPELLLEQFERKFSKKNIDFACRRQGNFHDANVLEDLFSMMNFDCLIRPVSHYSMTASHLGDFKIEMFPKNGYRDQNKRFVVNKVEVIENASWDPCKKKWEPLKN